MFILAIIMGLLGSVLWVASGIWFYVEVFKTGLLWFLGSFFLFPIVTLIWLATHLEDGIKPVLGMLVGLGLIYYGYNNQTLWRF